VPAPPADNLPAAVTADVTVAFGVLKPALVVGSAAARAGRVELVDTGLDPHLRTEPAVRVPDWTDIEGWWPALTAASEKYTRGVVGIATGSATYPGAAVLSVAGALAGLTGPVLLVDDLVDSGWTMTMVDRLLRRAGATGVLPLALAVAG
ncbi:hypothetical protein ACFQ0D_36125, partial [Micromonospora zhanjiangensis]